jgi:hypothetical protein
VIRIPTSAFPIPFSNFASSELVEGRVPTSHFQSSHLLTFFLSAFRIQNIVLYSIPILSLKRSAPQVKRSSSAALVLIASHLLIFSTSHLLFSAFASSELVEGRIPTSDFKIPTSEFPLQNSNFRFLLPLLP